jgi:hypothetical protein
MPKTNLICELAFGGGTLRDVTFGTKYGNGWNQMYDFAFVFIFCSPVN